MEYNEIFTPNVLEHIMMNPIEALLHFMAAAIMLVASLAPFILVAMFCYGMWYLAMIVAGKRR